jgi:hypothetical protein
MSKYVYMRTKVNTHSKCHECRYRSYKNALCPASNLDRTTNRTGEIVISCHEFVSKKARVGLHVRRED